MFRLPRFLFGLITCITVLFGLNSVCFGDNLFGGSLEDMVAENDKNSPAWTKEADQKVKLCEKLCGTAVGCTTDTTQTTITFHCPNGQTIKTDKNGNKISGQNTPAVQKTAKQAEQKKAKTAPKKQEKEVVAKQKTTDIKTINSPNKVSRERGKTEARAEAVKATGLSEPFQCMSVNEDKPNYLCAGSDTGTNIKIVFAGWSEEKANSAENQKNAPAGKEVKNGKSEPTPKRAASVSKEECEKSCASKICRQVKENSVNYTCLQLNANEYAFKPDCESKCSGADKKCKTERNAQGMYVYACKTLPPLAENEYTDKATCEGKCQDGKCRYSTHKERGHIYTCDKKNNDAQSDEQSELKKDLKSDAQQIIDAYNERKAVLESQKQ